MDRWRFKQSLLNVLIDAGSCGKRSVCEIKSSTPFKGSFLVRICSANSDNIECWTDESFDHYYNYQVEVSRSFPINETRIKGWKMNILISKHVVWVQCYTELTLSRLHIWFQIIPNSHSTYPTIRVVSFHAQNCKSIV